MNLKSSPLQRHISIPSTFSTETKGKCGYPSGIEPPQTRSTIQRISHSATGTIKRKQKVNKSKSKPIYETLILQHFSYSNGRSRTHKCKNQSLVTLPFRLRWNVNLLLIREDCYQFFFPPRGTAMFILPLQHNASVLRQEFTEDFSSARTRTQNSRTRIWREYHFHHGGMNERLFIRTILFDFHHLITSQTEMSNWEGHKDLLCALSILALSKPIVLIRSCPTRTGILRIWSSLCQPLHQRPILNSL